MLRTGEPEPRRRDAVDKYARPISPCSAARGWHVVCGLLVRSGRALNHSTSNRRDPSAKSVVRDCRRSPPRIRRMTFAQIPCSRTACRKGALDHLSYTVTAPKRRDLRGLFWLPQPPRNDARRCCSRSRRSRTRRSNAPVLANYYTSSSPRAVPDRARGGFRCLRALF